VLLSVAAATVAARTRPHDTARLALSLLEPFRPIQPLDPSVDLDLIELDLGVDDVRHLQSLHDVADREGDFETYRWLNRLAPRAAAPWRTLVPNEVQGARRDAIHAPAPT
jgi:hypothetical protein